jgi:hypothetical protein
MAETTISAHTRSSCFEDCLDCVEPNMLMRQAEAVITVAFRLANHRANQYWGLKLLIDGVIDDVEAASESPSYETYDKASNALAAALSLIAAFNSDAVDDKLLYAVVTILATAKGKLDDAWQAFELLAVEVQHG